VAQAGVYVFTDHKAIIGLTKHKDLVNSTAMSNKNLRLIRALEYVSKFAVTVLHKPGKLHIIPDALSRLESEDGSNQNKTAEGGLDLLPDDAEEHWDLGTKDSPVEHAFATEVLPAIRLGTMYGQQGDQPPSKGVSLMQISPEFKKKLQQGYLEDKKWKQVLDQIKKNIKLGDNQAQLPFYLKHGLLWRTSETLERLCVPRTAAPEIFQLLHGQNHLSAEKFRHSLLQFVIDRQELKKYLKTCPECSILKSRNHKPYGSLQPILSPPCPFHTVTTDIATGLPEARSGYNAFMVIVCKFSKACQILLGRHDWTAEQWANEFVDRCLLTNWGIPKIILSDRDPKFLSDFWKQIWRRLGTLLLYATAYHPSTDGQSERFILIIKSTLRYYFHALEDNRDWDKSVPRLQFELNNSRSGATGRTPNEVVFGFTPNFVVDAITDSSQAKPVCRIQVSDAIALSSMTAKRYYDARHKPMFFKPGDRVLLRLHKGYNIPAAAVLGRKLGQQFSGPFRVLEQVGRLAYRLEFPPHFQIHDVISVDHLEPAPPLDTFGRFFPHPGDVHLEQHEKRITYYDTKSKRYLVEYVGLGPEYDRWYNEKALREEKHLIEDWKMRRGEQ